MTPLDSPAYAHTLEPMTMWPPAVAAILDPTGRYAAILDMASDRRDSCHEWAVAMVEHFNKNQSLGWDMAESIHRAWGECRSHIPKSI